MNRSKLILFMLVASLAFSACAVAKDIHVSPNGADAAAGTADAPLRALAQAVKRAEPGDVIRLADGEHKIVETVVLDRSGTESQPITIQPADPNARPVLDCSDQPTDGKADGILIKGDWWRIVGIEGRGSGHNAFKIVGHHNVLERCVAHDNRNTGIQVAAPASHNLIVGCDSFRNYDPQTFGENADGFGCKFEVGEGNVFRNCRAWENSDDGWDLWKAPNPVRIEHCVAFRNGINLWDAMKFTGNGNGFKLGGAQVPARHVVIGCVAIDQPKRGFDQNNNTAGLIIEDCTAVRCEVGFWIPKAPAEGKHSVRNCLSHDAPVRIAPGSAQEANRWSGEAPQPPPQRGMTTGPAVVRPSKE